MIMFFLVAGTRKILLRKLLPLTLFFKKKCIYYVPISTYCCLVCRYLINNIYLQQSLHIKKWWSEQFYKQESLIFCLYLYITSVFTYHCIYFLVSNFFFHHLKFSIMRERNQKLNKKQKKTKVT